MSRSLFLAMALSGAAGAEDPVALSALFATPDITDVQLSPDGLHYAALIQHNQRWALEIVNIEKGVPFTVNGAEDAQVTEFHWVSDDRLVYSLSLSEGGNQQLIGTGEWLGINADGSKQKYLFGWRGEQAVGTRINKGTEVMAYGEMLDTLENNDRHMLLTSYPFGSGDAVRDIWRVDVRSGSKLKVGRMPAQRATALVDHEGNIRLAYAPNRNGISNDLYARDVDSKTWRPLNIESSSGQMVAPISMAADNQRFYAVVSAASGPDGLVLIDPLSSKFEMLARHDLVDPYFVVQTRRKPGAIMAVGFDAGEPLVSEVEASPEATITAGFQATFRGEHVHVVNSDREGKRFLIEVSSERRPSDWYLFDSDVKKARPIGRSLSGFEPADLMPSEAVSLKASDGLTLHGYLTRGKSAGKDPGALVVLVHGGPYLVRDHRSFDPEVQALATRGYHVLQVNFRGSGGYGKAFSEAGAKQWGERMQDDLSDATDWAIAQGIADAKRVCIMGASYGAYAALMGVAKDPDRYQCAVGAFGVYDLALMFERGDIEDSQFGINYLKNMLGKDRAQLDQRSPVHLAASIKAPVLLIAGGLDQRAPEVHSKRMREALESLDKPVEYLAKADEGHGFVNHGNLVEQVENTLDFLAEHLGAQ